MQMVGNNVLKSNNPLQIIKNFTWKELHKVISIYHLLNVLWYDISFTLVPNAKKKKYFYSKWQTCQIHNLFASQYCSIATIFLLDNPFRNIKKSI